MEQRNYSGLREEAEQLYSQLGRPKMSNHFGVNRRRAQNLDEIADEKLPTLISDLKALKGTLGVK